MGVSQEIAIFVKFPDNMEVTRDYIHQLLIKVDSFFQENIDPGFAVASPSKYVIKPIADLQADLSYDDIWRTGEHLSAEQLTDVLFSDSIKFNFWDFQLVQVKSSSMCIIVFLNYYPEQVEIGIHCAFPSIYSLSDSRCPGNKCIFLIVKSVIDRFDLYGLSEGGAPEDEFDEESREIANRISKDRTPEQIAVVIADVFNKAFDLCDSPDIFIKPAKKIKVLLSQGQ